MRRSDESIAKQSLQWTTQFHFTISTYLFRTLHPMLHCICMYVDVIVCVCQT